MKMLRRRPFALLTVVALWPCCLPVASAAAEQPASVQKTFASPEEAATALRAAAKVHDIAKLRDIFGPEIHDLMTGDPVQDKANSLKLAAALGEGAKPLSEGDGKVVLEIGSNKWPFPIPLVKTGLRWRFDTAAGKEEIVDRHVGKDELHAIGVFEAYAQAQKQYASVGRDSSGTVQYARKLKSSSGRTDGLYWETSPEQVQSPFGAAVAEADAGGETISKPFHGYFFKVLTRQGASAPGGSMDYVKGDRLTQGFALVAYPEHWGRSGIMTFIVNQDGKIYQRDLGAVTSQVAAAMTEYDPDGGWTPVKDQGVTEK